jgi:hypothetical protein
MEIGERVIEVEVSGEALSTITYMLTRINERARDEETAVWAVSQVESSPDNYLITLSSPLTKIENYTLLGRHNRNKTFIPVEGFTYEPNNIDNVVCSVCGTKQAKYHYLLLDNENKEFFVSAPCLKKFSPSHYYDIEAKIKIALSSPKSAIESMVKKVDHMPHYPIVSVIATALWVQETSNGYISKKRATHIGQLSSAESMDRIISNVEHGKKSVNQGLEEAESAWPTEVVAKLFPAAVLYNWVIKTEDDSDYFVSLKKALARQDVTRHSFPLIAALPMAYQRANSTLTGLGDNVPGHEYSLGHIGIIGERLTLQVEVEGRKELDSGIFVFIMRNDSGHKLFWYTGSPQGFPLSGPAKIMGTVKAHREYRGITETAINRVVLKP